MNDNSEKYSNSLIHESSPYLLQHAHNPVNWNAWNDENLDKAKEENKLILISIGYSACHWCHVMEHESFEDEKVAELMNSHYINIKVDREERPDVDQVYMNAVQVMTGMGGWPMNVVALPDGRPVWGGTYFRKEQWMQALEQIAHLYKSQPEKLLEYAEKLEQGLKQIQIIEPVQKPNEFHKDFYLTVIEKWKRSFDKENGGYKRAPKFMLPNNYEFLLRYAFQNSDEELKNYCLHTLNKISWGGVFDPIEGGFSRYSVDEKWHVPHFEKMLYDNAQLVRLFTKAFKISGNTWFKEVVQSTLKFIENEMTDESGAFYSALDADSENIDGEKEEGAYYVWTKEELSSLLKDEFELFSKYYNINNYGKWEGNNYVLIRTSSQKEICNDLHISKQELSERISKCTSILKKARRKRKKPGLDDKSLTSWNALMISGYTKASEVFREEKYLEIAEKGAEFIFKNQIQTNGRLYHSYKNEKSTINGYLEDYAFTITAFLDLYETSFKEVYLQSAEKLIRIVEEDFQDTSSGLYFFSSKKDRELVTKTLEINDNVIPASNSEIAKSLFRFGQLTGNSDYTGTAKRMLQTVAEKIQENPQSYSNWLDLMLNFTHPFYEIAITGANYKDLAAEFQKKFLPNCVIAGTSSDSQMDLLKNRFKKGDNLIYICQEGSCKLPLNTVEAALKSIHQV